MQLITAAGEHLSLINKVSELIDVTAVVIIIDVEDQGFYHLDACVF